MSPSAANVLFDKMIGDDTTVKTSKFGGGPDDEDPFQILKPKVFKSFLNGLK